MKDQFKWIEDFSLKYKPISPNPIERRVISNGQRKDEFEVENIKGKLGLHGQEDDVIAQGLRRDGISE